MNNYVIYIFDNIYIYNLYIYIYNMNEVTRRLCDVIYIMSVYIYFYGCIYVFMDVRFTMDVMQLKNLTISTINKSKQN